MKKNVFIIGLFFIGLLIVLYPHIARYSNSIEQDEKIGIFQEEIKLVNGKEATERISSIRQCNESIFESPDVFQDPFSLESTVKGAIECTNHAIDETIFAVLEIPKLKLNEPIYIGATPENLDKGIGQVEGSSIPIGGVNTHSVLAGHRGGITRENFQHLDKLDEGDEFSIRSLNGTLTYRITGQAVILPHETDTLQIQENRDLATLITCHPYGSNTHRLLIYAERINETDDQASK